ncbi:hypothetical protein [Marinicauda algicola]|nr:hypothetical protein [Marinicauda algicola]
MPLYHARPPSTPQWLTTLYVCGSIAGVLGIPVALVLFFLTG